MSLKALKRATVPLRPETKQVFDLTALLPFTQLPRDRLGSKLKGDHLRSRRSDRQKEGQSTTNITAGRRNDIL